MATATPTHPVSTPLPRRRPDLWIQSQQYEGRQFHIVKDPVGLRYFRFQTTEHRILELLDGRHTLDEIRETFQTEFRPRELSATELEQFLARLNASGLLMSDAPERGRELFAARERLHRRKLIGTLANILYVKFDGFDPEPALRWLYPKVRWFFSPFGVMLTLALFVSALVLILTNLDQFVARPELRHFQAFFNAENLFWLWLALGVSKIFHEFGHGLMCKHFGGECHDMGVLFMVFTPCLYCNVSDAWMMPNKWHRIAISCGGMYVELMLASLATFLWWSTEPGALHNIAFSTMFVCSAQTVLMNANPLLRYDGYYILSDWLEIPNLRQKSAEAMQARLARLCLGLDPRRLRLPTRNQWLFLGYSIASYAYRWLLSVMILWFLYNFLKPYKLGSISAAFAGLTLVSLIVMPLYQQSRIVKQVRKAGLPWKWWRLAFTVVVLAGLAVGAVLVPLPLQVQAMSVIEPEDAAPVFVQVPARLVRQHVQPRQFVRHGEILAELTNPELEMGRRDLKHQADQLEVIARTAFALDRPADEHQARLALAEIEQQLMLIDKQLAELTLRAPRDGIVLPPPPKADGSSGSDTLPEWSRDPLQPENEGCQFHSGTLFCSVAAPHRMRAVLVLSQSEVETVREGQPVRLKLDALPDVLLLGHVQEIALQDAKQAPTQLSTAVGGDLPTDPQSHAGASRLLTPHYQVRVSIDEIEGADRDQILPTLLTGLRGRARINCGTRTVWQRLWRTINETFHL